MTYQNPTYCQNLSVAFSHNTFFGETPKNENSRKLRLDYYLFGSPMYGRSFNSNSYKFGFNSQMKEDEIYGEGNVYDLGLRMYDARLARMFSIDPRSFEYPWQSPYVYHRNSPIAVIDFMGGGDPEKLKKAAKKGVETAKKWKKKYKSACNRTVQAAVSYFTDGKVDITGLAKDMYSDLQQGKYADFEPLDVNLTTEEGKKKVQELANQGELIVGVSNRTNREHTVMFVPGDMAEGKNWKGGGDMPLVLEGGSYGTFESTPLTTASGQATVKAMKLYIYKPGLKVSNSDNIQQQTNAIASSTIYGPYNLPSVVKTAQTNSSSFKRIGPVTLKSNIEVNQNLSVMPASIVSSSSGSSIGRFKQFSYKMRGY